MTGAGTGRPYRLRACAMVTTRSWTPEIIEFGRVDIETRGNEVIRTDEPMSALYRQTGCLPEPDDVAGISEDDLRRRRSCTPSVLKRAIWAPTPPDVLVAHGASRMRMLIPATTHMPLPWICTAKVARILCPTAPGYTLDELAVWLGLSAEDEPAPTHHDRAAVQASRLAALLTELARGATLNQMLLFSAAITAPLIPPPLPDDDAGWRLVPDDELAWFAHHAIQLPIHVKPRAARERARRIAAGGPRDVGFDPYTLPD